MLLWQNSDWKSFIHPEFFKNSFKNSDKNSCCRLAIGKFITKVFIWLNFGCLELLLLINEILSFNYSVWNPLSYYRQRINFKGKKPCNNEFLSFNSSVWNPSHFIDKELILKEKKPCKNSTFFPTLKSLFSLKKMFSFLTTSGQQLPVY